MKAGRIYPESKQSLKTLLETHNTEPFAMGVGGRRGQEGATVLQDQFIVLQLHCAGSGGEARGPWRGHNKGRVTGNRVKCVTRRFSI